MNIEGGGLHFESTLDNDQIKAAIDETLRRVQGLSDATVAGGKAIDGAFQKTADDIKNTFQDIDIATETNRKALQKLEAEYAQLGEMAGKAFMSGNDNEYRAITEKQNAIKGEIVVRKQVLKEIGEQSDALVKAESSMEAERKKMEQTTNANVTFRTQLRKVTEELAMMEENGKKAGLSIAQIRSSPEFTKLQQEAGRLTNAMGDARTQARILAHDNQGLQGVISAVSGVTGAFTVAQGAIGLFGDKNEDLQKIMLRVQSLMAITMGLQQVANAVNKDSALMIKLQAWWIEVKANAEAKAVAASVAKTATTTASTTAETANTAAIAGNTVAETANIVATGGQAAVATAGTVANIGLAGAFRLVGTAIKSIPVFGWILAGISALIGLYSYFSSKVKEAAKAQAEFSKSLIEGCYKSIAAIENLSYKWNQLGNDLDAKTKFIKDNKKAFEELGVAVRDVADAESILNSKKEEFINAQIEKAKAVIYFQQTQNKVKKMMELESEISKMKDTKTKYITDTESGRIVFEYEVENSTKTKKKEELAKLKEEITQGYTNAAKAESESIKNMEKIGIDAANTYKEGTVGAIEQAIADKQSALKLLNKKGDYDKGLEELKTLQKELESITGKKTTNSSSSHKDPFLEKLEKQKKEYHRFMQWLNSGDETLSKAANKEFDGLLKQGATYIDYLKKQQEIIEKVDVSKRTKVQNAQLRTLNDQIAEETKKTVLESFNNELSEQLDNAKSIMAMLLIIEQKRSQLANDGTELDNSKKESLANAEKGVVKKAKEETDALLENYSSYLDRKIKLEQKYTEDMILLEKKLKEAKTGDEKQSIQSAITNRTKQHQKDTKNDGDTDYTALLNDYATFEQKKQAIIAEYDEKRQKAAEYNNQQLVKKLNKAQVEAISTVAMETITNSELWENLFKNVDEMTLKEIDFLIEQINKKSLDLKADLTDKDIKNLIKELKGLHNEVANRNPFTALYLALAKFNKQANSANLQDILYAGSNLANNFSQISDSMRSIAEQIGSDNLAKAADLMDDVIGNFQAAEKGAESWGGWWGAIIGGVVDLIPKIIKWTSGDADKEKAIQSHAAAVNELERAYTALSWAIDKALGGEVYKHQQAAINNMKQQQQHLIEMQNDEADKKNPDDGKINEYKSQYEELGRQIQDMLDNIASDILQIDAKTFANELGDALANAFAKGESAADAFGETVDKVIKNAVLNQLKKNFLETQLQGALDNLEKSMGYWNGDSFVFEGLTDTEIAAFKAQVANITAGFDQAMEAYSNIFKDIDTSDTSLTGAVKGVTEETASMVGGQMNAIRINQIEATQIIRQQLFHLANIDRNTSYNKYIESIYNHLKQNSTPADPLRSQGLA